MGSALGPLTDQKVQDGPFNRPHCKCLTYKYLHEQELHENTEIQNYQHLEGNEMMQ